MASTLTGPCAGPVPFVVICHEAAVHCEHASGAQGGTVSTMALDFGVSLVCCPAPDRVVRLRSSAFAGTVEFSLDSVPARSPYPAAEEASWGNFPRGAAVALQKGGHR